MIPRLREKWTAARPYAVPALAFLAIVLAMFWRLWTPIPGARRTFGWDAQWEYWGDLQLQLDAWRRAELPLWNPFDRAGYPLHADPQAGVLYPVTWLLLGVGALAGGAQWWLVSVKIVFHFWLAGVGMYAYLRRRGTAVPACYAGGLILILTYPFVHNLFSALNWGMAWAPWILLAIDAAAERPTTRSAALLALALGMGWLAGAPAAFWYTLLVCVPYGAWAFLHHARAAEDRRAYLRRAAAVLGVAAGLFVALVAAQLGATAALVGHTVRDSRDLAFLGTTAFTPDDVVAFFIPRYPAGGENTYLGVIAIIGAAAALTLRPSARALVLGGAAMLGVLCAWGDIGLFLPIEASLVPPFGFFRRAHRYLYVTVVPVAILGAEGLAALAALEAAEARRRVGNLLLGVGALGVLLWGTGFIVKARDLSKIEPWRDAYACAFVSTLVSAFLLRQVVTQDGAWRRVFLAVAVVALGADLWFSRSFVVDRNMYPIPDTRADRDARTLAGLPLAVRVYDREYLKFRPGARLGLRDLGGYENDPLALSRYVRLRDAVHRAPRLLGHANVGFLLEAGGSVLAKQPADTAALRVIKPGVLAVAEVAPAVVWVGRPTVVDTEAAAVPALVATRPGTQAVLERGTLSAAERAAAAAGAGVDAAPVAGRFVEYGRNRLVAEVTAPTAGVVVIAEAYFPGWSATVDGCAARIVPANGLFRGVFVGPGAHTIVMRYRARGYLALAVVELCALGAALCLVWRGRRRGA